MSPNTATQLALAPETQPFGHLIFYRENNNRYKVVAQTVDVYNIVDYYDVGIMFRRRDNMKNHVCWVFESDISPLENFTSQAEHALVLAWQIQVILQAESVNFR